MDVYGSLLVGSACLNVLWLALLFSQRCGWKEAIERADKYQDAFSAKVTDCEEARSEAAGLRRLLTQRTNELKDTLKQYSDKVYEADEDVWLAVFKSGVENE